MGPLPLITTIPLLLHSMLLHRPLHILHGNIATLPYCYMYSYLHNSPPPPLNAVALARTRMGTGNVLASPSLNAILQHCYIAAISILLHCYTALYSDCMARVCSCITFSTCYIAASQPRETVKGIYWHK